MGGGIGGGENVLKLDSGDDCITLWIYYKPLNCTFLKGELYGLGIISE